MANCVLREKEKSRKRAKITSDNSVEMECGN